jgi:hypothetical protein
MSFPSGERVLLEILQCALLAQGDGAEIKGQAMRLLFVRVLIVAVSGEGLRRSAGWHSRQGIQIGEHLLP